MGIAARVDENEPCSGDEAQNENDESDDGACKPFPHVGLLVGRSDGRFLLLREYTQVCGMRFFRLTHGGGGNSLEGSDEEEFPCSIEV